MRKHSGTSAGNSYIASLLRIPKRKQLEQRPLDALYSFLLVLLGVFDRKCQVRNIRPIRTQIKIK